MNPEFLFWLLFAHFLGDFALQPAWMAKMKKVDPWTLFGHAFIWTGVISLWLSFFGIFSLCKVAWLLVGHIILDCFKDSYGARVSVFWKNTIDQGLHILQILIII